MAVMQSPTLENHAVEYNGSLSMFRFAVGHINSSPEVCVVHGPQAEYLSIVLRESWAMDQDNFFFICAVWWGVFSLKMKLFPVEGG